MTCHIDFTGWNFTNIHWLMRQDPLIDHFLFNYFYPLSLILKFTHNIMVAHHELKTAGREMINDLSYHFPLFIIMAVEQITEKYRPCGLPVIDKVDQGLRVFMVG